MCLTYGLSIAAQTGGVLIGQKTGSKPDPSAILELFSSNKGLLIPRATITAISSPAEGLLVFDTDSSRFMYYSGVEWVSLVNELRFSETNSLLQTQIYTKIDSVSLLFSEKLIAQEALTDSLSNIFVTLDGDGLSQKDIILNVNAATGLTVINDTIRIVTGDSAQVMVTNADGTGVEWVAREEIGKPLFAGSNIVVADIGGKNIVSLQDTIAVSMIGLDGDSANAIATTADWGVIHKNKEQTLTSVAYTHKSIKESGDEIDFLFGEKSITRAGLTGLTGASLNADNLEDFLKKVFFPVPFPYISALTYNDGTNSATSFQRVDAETKMITATVGTLSLPYSVWVSSSNLIFNFTIVNQSVNSDSEDTPIAFVSMKKGADFLDSYQIPAGSDLNDTIKGSFSVAISNLKKADTVSFVNSLSMSVIDSYPNNQLLPFDVVAEKAIQASVTSVDAGAQEVDFDGTDVAFDLNWVVDAGDETITATSVDGNLISTPTDITNSVTMLASNDRQKYTVGVTGSIFNSDSTKDSGYKYWTFPCSYGFIDLGIAGANDITKIDNTVADLITDYTLLKAAVNNGSSTKEMKFRSADGNYFTQGVSSQNSGYEINLPAASGKVFLAFTFPKRGVVDINTWKLMVYNPLNSKYEPLSTYKVVELPNYVGSESYYLLYSTFIKVNASNSEYYKLSKN